MMDLQTVVPCLQQDHTDLVPACSTYFDCGLTTFLKPGHSVVKSLWVADRVDPVSHHEDPTAPVQYCRSIRYHQVEATRIRRYLQCHHDHSLTTMSEFFGFFCHHRIKQCYPRPTDAGLPTTLPELPLGIHYAQASTDGRWRSLHGVWAIENGKIWVAPWIQSSEVIILKWDGLDRQMVDNKPMDPSPLLRKAIYEYVFWQHAGRWDQEWAAAQDAQIKYEATREALVRECMRETQSRVRTPSQAQDVEMEGWVVGVGSSSTIGTGGSSGSGSGSGGGSGTGGGSGSGSGSGTGGGSGGGSTSTMVIQNTQQPDVVVYCTTNDVNAPAPTGNPVTVSVPAGVSGASVTVLTTATQEEIAAAQAQANLNAIAIRTAQAQSQLSCTWSNSTQTAQFTCSDTTVKTGTSLAGTITSDISQTDANNKAKAAALADAQNQCSLVGPGNPQVTAFAMKTIQMPTVPGHPPIICTARVTVIVPPNTVHADTIGHATLEAQNLAQQEADLLIQGQTVCGAKTFIYNPSGPPSQQ